MKVEGRNSVYELLKTDKEIDKILVQKDLKDEPSKRLINIIRSNKVKIQLVDKYVVENDTAVQTHVRTAAQMIKAVGCPPLRRPGGSQHPRCWTGPRRCARIPS